MPRVQDAWNEIVGRLNLNLDADVNYVRAADIHRLAGREPRLVASMDSQRKLPELFRRKGVFVLPVGHDTYAIVHGRGYHELEPIESKPTRYQATLPFELTTLAYGKSETRHLLNAYHSGILSHFSGVDQMFETLSGRGRTGSFEFRVDGSPMIRVQGAQMEIDKAFEGKRDVLLFEAKATGTDTFLTRQLYYPYRVASSITNKDVRAFFFLANPRDKTYRLWEYRWEDPADYESIVLVRKRSYLVTESEPRDRTFDRIEPDPTIDIVPQANDFQKVADLPLLVDAGIATAASWADHYGITLRQGNYYREAAEALGLVQSESGHFYLTDEGRRYARLPTEERDQFLATRLLRVPIINQVYHLARERADEGLGIEDVSKIIQRASHLTGKTPGRRASTVLSYFRWFASSTGAILVTQGRIHRRGGNDK